MTKITIQTKTHEIVCESIEGPEKVWRVRARKLGTTDTDLQISSTAEFPGLLLGLASPESVPDGSLGELLRTLLAAKFTTVQPFDWQQ